VTDRETNKLGEVLSAAREGKGVDLARVERDTKIRVRYLSALERGDYADLPGSVYTKGFLRNYGVYLGLDPEYLVDLYRLESTVALRDRPTVTPPPRPITTRRRGALVITPGAVVAALLTFGVAAFIFYVVSQFTTFAGVPELRITDPAGDLSGYDGSEYTIVGVTEPNSRIEVDGLRQNPSTTADADGDFEIDVGLVPGSNVITLTATDPITNRDSQPVSRTIVVGDAPSPSAGAVVLAVTSPEEDAAVTGPVEVAGTAEAGRAVTVTATFVSAPPATIRITSLSGEQVSVPASNPTAPDPLAITAGADGAFAGSLTLAAGTWQLSIAAEGAEPVARRVVVQPPAGLAGSIVVAGSPSYLEIDEDGVPKPNVSGRNAQPGARITLTARSTLRIRVGNAAAVSLVVNGVNLGAMGERGAVVEWTVTRL
jgi:cytoskeletal protein RodZ